MDDIHVHEKHVLPTCTVLEVVQLSNEVCELHTELVSMYVDSISHLSLFILKSPNVTWDNFAISIASPVNTREQGTRNRNQQLNHSQT